SAPASTCTSRRRGRRGSTSSSGGLPCSPRNSSVEACTAAPASWRPRSSATSRSPTRARSRSCGPKPPTRSSNRWPVLSTDFGLGTLGAGRERHRRHGSGRSRRRSDLRQRRLVDLHVRRLLQAVELGLHGGLQLAVALHGLDLFLHLIEGLALALLPIS